MSELSVSQETLPAPSAELVLWRVAVECFVAVSGRRKGEAFLKLMTEKLASEQNLSAVLPFRPTAQAAAVRRARLEAIELWRQYLPVFLARVPKHD